MRPTQQAMLDPCQDLDNPWLLRDQTNLYSSARHPARTWRILECPRSSVHHFRTTADERVMRLVVWEDHLGRKLKGGAAVYTNLETLQVDLGLAKVSSNNNHKQPAFATIHDL